MDDGLQMVNSVCDQAEKILPHTSLEGKKRIEEQVTELTNDWEKLNSDIIDCTAVLEGVQQRWHEYEEYYGSLIKWLAGMEDSLNPTPEVAAQLPERKAQLDKYMVTFPASHLFWLVVDSCGHLLTFLKIEMCVNFLQDRNVW